MKEDAMQKEIQKAYVDLQMINQQINQNQQQTQAIEEQANELSNTLESLEDIKNTEKGSKILVSLSSGIFTKADLTNNEECIVNVGAGITVKKSIDDTKELLKEQLNNLNIMQKQLTSNTEQLVANAHSIEKGMEKISLEKN